MKKHKYFIGIDPGVNTGFAVWSREDKAFKSVNKLTIHEAMGIVKGMTELDICSDEDDRHFIKVEDARKRKWFGKAGREQLQGAGSIKRDCKIWEDFLTDLRVDFEMVAPKNNKTKLNADSFKKITGWKGKTNEHSRDAAMLVYGL